jgi:hypothetical protein
MTQVLPELRSLPSNLLLDGELVACNYWRRDAEREAMARKHEPRQGRGANRHAGRRF